MPLIRLSASAWKWLVVALALAIGSLVMRELGNGAGLLLRDGQQGTLGVVLSDLVGSGPDPQGTHFLRIAALAPDSPLATAGAHIGEHVRFERPLDRWRKFAPDEIVALTLFNSRGAQRLQVRARPEAIGFADQLDYWGRAAVALPALLFGVLVGIRQPVGRAYRCLTLLFFSLATAFYFSFTYAAPGAISTAAKLIQLALNSTVWWWCAGFALDYQPYPRTPLRTWLTAVRPAFRMLVLGTAAYTCWFGLGNEAPMLWLFVIGTLCAGLALVILSLSDGWRNCLGEMRHRHRWLIFAMACGSIPPLLTMVPALDWSVNGARVTVMLYFGGQLLMYALLTYAALRHRVFDFNFAISRAVGFSGVSLILLCTFGLIEWALAPLLHAAPGGATAPQPRLLADAALAVAVCLCFNQVHGRIERRVERLFFRRWHDAEQTLRGYLAQAVHITSIDQLLASMTEALDRFSGQAGAGVYLRQPGGQFALAASTVHAAATSLNPNDALIVALRADLVPLHPALLGEPAAGELALPMCHRGALLGFIVLGSKPQGESYRPDEVSVLGFAAQQLGLDLHALRVEALDSQVRGLIEHTAQQGERLLAAAGRRVSWHARAQAAPLPSVAAGESAT